MISARSPVLALVSSFLCTALAASNDILSTLRATADVTAFTAHLRSRSHLVDTLNKGSFTVLVPNDEGFGKSHAVLDFQTVDAYLNYHILKSTFPTSKFSSTPVFAPTLLDDPVFANVTGGQVAELVLQDGGPTVITGLKKASKIVKSDIPFSGGLVHVVDAVSTIPDFAVETATELGLEGLLDLWQQLGWSDPNNNEAVDILVEADLTIFSPADPSFGASNELVGGLSAAEQLSLLEANVVAGEVLYSTNLTHTTKVETQAETPVTVHLADGKVQVNGAQLVTTDYLTRNGVLHITDRFLVPNQIN